MCTENRYSRPNTVPSDLGQTFLALVFKRCARSPSRAFVAFLALVTVSVLTCCCVVVVRTPPNARIIISEARESDISYGEILNRTSTLDRFLDDEFDAAKRQNRTQPTQNYSDDVMRRRRRRIEDVKFLRLQPLLSSDQTPRQATRPKNSTHLRPSSSAQDHHSIHSDGTISFSDWLLLQVNRTAQMLETCATFTPPKNSADAPPPRRCGRRLDGIFVDKSRRILYCAIPKVATSSVKLAMALMTGRVNRTAAVHYGSSYPPVHSTGWLRSVGIFSLDYLIDNDSRWLKGAWSSLRKFLVVRDPVERLVSAYVDKFTLRNRFSDYFQHRYGRRIVRLYRNASAKNGIADENGSSGGGHDVTFREFVRFLFDRTIPCVHRSNPHWMSYHDLCHPCFIDYDFVVRFENLADEMHHLWRSLYRKGSSVGDVLPRRNAGKTRSSELVGRYVDQLPAGYLSGLYDTYEMDFRMFMYSL